MGTKRRKGRKGRRAPAVVSGRPLLSLAMMVRDEEALLEDALRSAKAICDELVVVDTGSVDRTVEIARDLGARVSHFAWCDDFSAARNETLRLCRGDWIAYLDADERFVGASAAAVARLLVPGDHHPFEAIQLRILNRTLAGDLLSSFHSPRLLPNDHRLRYQGVVHNRLVSLDPAHPHLALRTASQPEIVHLGYDRELYLARRKAERSLPLIEGVVAREPDNHQYRYYLGRELLALGRLDDAAAQLAEVLRRLDAGAAPAPAELRREAALTLVEALVTAAAPLAEVERVAQASLARAPADPDLWFWLGISARRHCRPADAAAALRRALDLLDSSGPAAGRSRLEHRRWEATEQLGLALFDAGSYPEAYRALLAAREDKPAHSAGWPETLNCLIGLAIDLRDSARLPDLLEALCARAEAPLDLFFFEVERRAREEGKAAALRLLEDAAARHPRLRQDPACERWTAALRPAGAPPGS